MESSRQERCQRGSPLPARPGIGPGVLAASWLCRLLPESQIPLLVRPKGWCWWSAQAPGTSWMGVAEKTISVCRAQAFRGANGALTSLAPFSSTV